MGVGEAEGCSFLLGIWGEGRCRASKIQTPCPKCRTKTIFLVLIWEQGELDGVFVRKH